MARDKTDISYRRDLMSPEACNLLAYVILAHCSYTLRRKFDVKSQLKRPDITDIVQCIEECTKHQIPPAFNHHMYNVSTNHRICQNSFNTFQSTQYQNNYKNYPAVCYTALIFHNLYFPPFILFETFISSIPTI